MVNRWIEFREYLYYLSDALLDQEIECLHMWDWQGAETFQRLRFAIENEIDVKLEMESDINQEYRRVLEASRNNL